MVDKHSPCKGFKCSRCCTDTEMTLSLEDVERIEEMGHKGFFKGVDGYLCLVNVDNICFFLKNGLCSIYEHRPLGCRLYPVIYDEEGECAILDDFCPHTEHFQVEDWKEGVLAKAIALEDKERSKRLREG